MRIFFILAFFIFFLSFSLAFSQASSLELFCNAGGPYSVGSNIIVYGNVSEAGTAVSDADINITIKKDGILKANVLTKSSDDGVFFIVQRNFDVGSYSAEIFAKKDAKNATCLANFKVISSVKELHCFQKTIKIVGNAISLDGKPISGVAFARVEGTIYGNSTQFSGGIFTVFLDACLFMGEIYILSVTVEDAKGNFGTTQITFPVV